MSKKLLFIKCFSAVLAVCASTFPLDSTSVHQNAPKQADEIDSASTVIVTATRRAQQSRWISDDHTVLQVEKEAMTSSKSISEMLADRVPVFISDYGGGSSKKISLRGAGSERTLVLIDGKRVGTNDNDLSDLAVEAIRKVEVVEGGQSALYGMDAVGGVVNLITRKPLSDGTTGSFSSTIASYELNNGGNADLNTNGNQAMISHKNGPIEGLLAGNWSFSDGKYDYATTGNRYVVRDGNEYRNLVAFARMGYSVDNVTFGVTGSAGDRVIQNPGSITSFSPGTTRKNIVSTGIDCSWKANDYLTSRLSGSFGRDHIGFVARDVAMSQNSSHLHFNESAELVQEFTVHRQLLTTGVEYRRESMLSSDIGNHTVNQTGVFAGAVGSMSSESFTLQTTPTVRFDYSSVFKGTVNGKIGGIASVKTKGDPALFFNVGTASRTPTLNDLYWPLDLFGVGDTTLRPEKSVYVDGGLQVRGISGPAVAHARITAYRMQMRDMIIWQPDPSDPTGMRWTPRNLSQASIRGLHGAIDYSFGKIYTGTIGATWNDARDNKSKNVLIYRPEYVVTYSQSAAMGRVSAGMTCRYMSSVFTNDQNTAVLPDCTVFDARLGVGLYSSADEKKTMKLVYETLNFTNVRRSTNEGYPLPGREHRLSLKLSF